MGKHDLYKRLAEVFEVDSVDDDFNLEGKWESLALLSAIAEIDEEFSITVPVKDLTETKHASEVFALVERMQAVK